MRGKFFTSYSRLPLEDEDEKDKLCVTYYKDIHTSLSDGKKVNHLVNCRKYYLPDANLGFHIVKSLWFPIETYTIYVYAIDDLNYYLIKNVKEIYISPKSFHKIVDIYQDQKYLKKININSILEEIK